ncbi:selenocysteine-specific translation elongation factor [Glaciimonas soli]|uniref:Selenocysteine-specific elongation factor n=1 Tax=Glaciimonas soli TaxID=2590999 RepID=A0A843YLN2_9BURK|nr:selenocysteine-specific translation elongation factor [Glaciimonas soli]MQQ99829.1 selenocysteine-specific translation elongation factor [Glaciimonas soli]
MIVGTAGHIDHGKTTLTKALTGVDTDRLKEEKVRGISIELGYAYTPLQNGEILGLIDVPGHEKLIHTMAAGAAGIDFALLVIAADDGVMPQTKEHLAILELLGIRRGAVALTKVDRVDAAQVHAVEQQITALLAATPFAGAPIFHTQAHLANDSGVAALRQHLECAAQETAHHRDDQLFRLAIDRVFTLAGHGTIITGTALAGKVNIGDSLVLAPSGESVRVRSIHAQNQVASTGHAGQRLALNLTGIERERISRGNWIVAPSLAACSVRIDVELSLLADAGLILKPWSQIHLHLGAAHHTAHVALLEGDTLTPGQQARVQIVLDAPVHAMPGERFVIRNAQATRTIGGGQVLDPFGPTRKRRGPARHAWLDAMKAFITTADVRALLAASPLGLQRSALLRLSYVPLLNLPDDVSEVKLRGDDALLISKTAVDALCLRMLEALRTFHTSSPDEIGPQIARFKRIVEPDIDDVLWRWLVDKVCANKTMLQQGAYLHMPEHVITLGEQEQALAAQLLPLLEAGAYNPPWVRDMARELNSDEVEVRTVLRKLSQRGLVYQVIRDLFYHPARIDELQQVITTLVQEHPEKTVSAAAFRDATGLGRKRSIQLLEYFDRVGYTRRQRDAHVLR